MKNALILHGAGNNSQGNWFPWLQRQLEKRGYNVWSPDLPNSDIPKQNDWLNAIFSNKEWVFDNKSILIGHSSGATLILRILERLPDSIKIRKAILVATPIRKSSNSAYHPYVEDLVKDPFNWEKIKKSCAQFYFIHSDNDKYECTNEQGKILQHNLGGNLIVRKGEGHFNLEVGPQYKEFPFLLSLID